MKQPSIKWQSEADLCRAFVSALPSGWTCYAETCGFDMVLVHELGPQIAVEAKLTLNAKVLAQVIERRERSAKGPDFRAVLVGSASADVMPLAAALGVTVLTVKDQTFWADPWHGAGTRAKVLEPWNWQGALQPDFEISPKLPEFKGVTPRALERELVANSDYWWSGRDWHDEAPADRLQLPDYVPDVEAGKPSPLTLSEWKIKAIKICLLVERLGSVTRAHFADIGISPSRWTDGYWLRKGAGRGHWEAGPRFPANQFRREHPEVFAQIEADFAKWAPKVPEQQALPIAMQGELL